MNSANTFKLPKSAGTFQDRWRKIERFFMGQLMREAQGKSDPSLLNKKLDDILNP